MSLLRSLSITNVRFDCLQQNPTPLNVGAFSNLTNIQCPNEVRQYIAPTACLIYNYIVSQVNSNKFRGIHFNILIGDNFNNPELVILTTFALNLAYIKCKEGLFNNFEQALQQAATYVVDKRINFITINVSELANMAGSEINTITNNAQDYVNEAQGVENFLANTYMGSTVNANIGFGGQNQNMNTGFNNNFNNGFGNNNQGGFNGFGGNQGMGGGFNNQQPLTGFSSPSGISGFGQADQSRYQNMIIRVNPGEQPGNTQRFDRFNQDLMLKEGFTHNRVEPNNKQSQAEARPAQRQPIEVDEPFDYEKQFNEDGSVNTAALKVTDLPWKPSIYQQFPIAYVPSELKEIKLEIKSRDGRKSYVIQTFQRKTPMERSSHELPAAQKFLNQLLKNDDDRKKFRERAFDNARHANEKAREIRADKPENEHLQELDKIKSDGYIDFTTPQDSVEQAVSFARQASLIYGSDELGAYNMKFELTKDFAVKRSDIKAIEQVAESTSFKQLSENIRRIIEDDKAPKSLRYTMVQINGYLADKFNNYIRFFLGVVDYENVESYIDDVLPIIEDIESVYGKLYTDRINGSYRRFIGMYFTFSDSYVSEIALVGQEDKNIEQNDNTIYVMPVQTTCQIVCTEYLNSEFTVLMPEKTSAKISQSTSVGLFKLVNSLINNESSLTTRFFISTLDDFIYEVNIGVDKVTSPLLISKYH